MLVRRSKLHLFEGCSAKGGAGAIQGGGNFVAEDCVFRANVARERGGGAIVWPDGSIVLRRCRFEGNHAATNGGAVQAIGVPVQIEDCVFVGNSASRAGAVYVDGCSTSIAGCTFIANQATTAGALHCGAGNTTVAGCTVSDNSAATVSGIYSDDAAGNLEPQNTIVSYGTTGVAIRCGGKVVTVGACDTHGNQGGDWPSRLAGQLGHTPTITSRRTHSTAIAETATCISTRRRPAPKNPILPAARSERGPWAAGWLVPPDRRRGQKSPRRSPGSARIHSVDRPKFGFDSGARQRRA
ncbi:MAG: right-handed parallel beta-helix repeat-containing protein [Candidatus Eisenbacteria bacterium]